MSQRPSPSLSDTTAHTKSDLARALTERPVPALTLLCHPDPRRIGERAALPSLSSGTPLPISRLEPTFSPPAGGSGHPLIHPNLSRTPVLLRADRDSGLVIDRADSPTRVKVDGHEVETSHNVGAEHLDRGVVITLGRRVALLLHPILPGARRPPEFGLIGESDAILELRRRIELLATRHHAVLLRGETGTGKELVARALHRAGKRRDGPFRAINLGALPTHLAAAELFGAARGAFTGADAERLGYFRQADGGTLFLDEVAAAPPEVQAVFLRVLETGEIQGVGAMAPARVDVRVVAATDADLEDSVTKNTFSAPLLHRLSAHPILLPPLRHRRDDIGRLLVFFLRREAEAEGCLDRLVLRDPDEPPWLGAELVTRLALYPWPGNVRELKNVASQLVLYNIDNTEMRVPPELEKILQVPDAAPSIGRQLISDIPYRDARALGRGELERALREHAYEPSRVAVALGVARPSLYKRLRALGFPTAAELSDEAIREAAESCDGDLSDMAKRLRVSSHGLKMRLGRRGSN